jgi:sugar phosphate isomerase/epimerase
MDAFGIAGWLYHQPILHQKTMTQLDLPAASRQAGVDIVELCSAFFPSQTAAYLNDLRRAIRDAGVSVRNIAVDMGDISSADADRRRTDLEALKQWFHVARAIGAEAIRVNSGGSEPTTAGELARNVEGYQELAAEAEHVGVHLLIENHGGASFDPGHIKGILDAVGSPRLGTCPDTGNFVGGTWRDGIRVMAPVAFTCHVKVSAYTADGLQPRIGHDGRDRSADLKAILRTLKDSGYRGPLCIEAGVDGDETESARGAIRYVRELLEAI